jgi:hypothetical protein
VDGRVRLRAPIPVFSSTANTSALWGALRYSPQMSAARSQKPGHLTAGDPTAHPVRLGVQVGQDPADLGRGDTNVGQRVGELGMAPMAGRMGWFPGYRGDDP